MLHRHTNVIANHGDTAVHIGIKVKKHNRGTVLVSEGYTTVIFLQNMIYV